MGTIAMLMALMADMMQQQKSATAMMERWWWLLMRSDGRQEMMNKLLNKLSQILLCTIWMDKGLFDCRV